jgi:type III pantothenate kinase
MRLITVDLGNSHPHAGIFKNNDLIEVIPLGQYVKKSDDLIIVSSVINEPQIIGNFDLQSFRKKDSFFNMPVNYSMTLGMDRLLTAFYLFEENSKKEKILNIDAGTFMTLDLINGGGFQGGFIFPGLNTFLNSYQRGAKLPILNLTALKKLDIPHNTEDAILMASQIYFESVIKNCISMFEPTKVVITGGSSKIVKTIIEELNLGLEISVHPHLLHYSMNRIFDRHLKDL